jgi:hypothetical protein
VTVQNAISNRIRGRLPSAGRPAHWLDYARDRYGDQLVEDVKVLLRILVLYMPLPVFWALFDQQSSRWTLQGEFPPWPPDHVT